MRILNGNGLTILEIHLKIPSFHSKIVFQFLLFSRPGPVHFSCNIFCSRKSCLTYYIGRDKVF